MATLAVRNEAQRLILQKEMLGQLSDGRWENSRPRDHWQPWCRATLIVDPENVGRDFWVQCDGYNFREKELLEIVGERMLEAVRAGLNDPAYSEKQMRADLGDLRKIFKTRRA